MPFDGTGQSNPARNSLALVGERMLSSVLERFSRPQYVKRNRTILLLATALLLTLLLVPDPQLGGPHYKVGDIATSDIRATQDYLLEDKLLTDKKRAEAEAVVPYVYDFSPTTAQEITQRFEKAFSRANEAFSAPDKIDRAALRGEITSLLGIPLNDEELAAFLRVRNDAAVIAEINRASGIVFSRKVVSDKRILFNDLTRGIVMQDFNSCESLGPLERTASVIDTDEARKRLSAIRLHTASDPHDLEMVKGLLVRSLHPNLTFNREATEERRQAARAAVTPVLFQLKRGEMIVRSGERITEDQLRRLDQLFSGRGKVAKLLTGIGIFLMVLTLLYFPYRFALKNIRKFAPGNKDLLLLALVTLCHFGLLRISLMVSTGLGGMLPSVNPSTLYYLFPFAMAPMLVRIILNSEVALVYCAVWAPLAGLMFDSSLTVVIYALMGGVVGAHGVRHCKDRGVIYTAGFKVSVVNVALALSFQIYGDALFTTQTIYALVFAFISGFLNATLVTGLIPPVESMFQYTTDMKLLEFSNLNAPLLHNLMVSAPGTYHHSVLVGNLVEAAAEAIHANPLLARVAAYYHDVGKVSKPLYFIENVAGGDNKHDRLSPSMSALILIAHVKEGVELAREHRLGQPLIDIIRQSHGTGLISFFYQKAKTQSADPDSITEQDFRYPGPKPQTREAGLVLLADAVEAACRTITEPTPARIQGLVQKIINNIFIDGQLDECELTLKNLHEIAKSFNRVLNAIYHQRIDYPEPAFKEKNVGGRKPVEDSDIEPPATPQDRDTPPQKGVGEDLKRLGIGR